jgi:hypothetical protein
MSQPHESVQPPPEPPHGDGEQVHEYVVKQVRDVGREDKVVFKTGKGVDTGWRQTFPLTYDIPPPPAEAIDVAEGDGPPPTDR